MLDKNGKTKQKTEIYSFVVTAKKLLVAFIILILILFIQIAYRKPLWDFSLGENGIKAL